MEKYGKTDCIGMYETDVVCGKVPMPDAWQSSCAELSAYIVFQTPQGRCMRVGSREGIDRLEGEAREAEGFAVLERGALTMEKKNLPVNSLFFGEEKAEQTAVLVGCGSFIEIWDHDVYEDIMKQEEAEFDALLAFVEEGTTLF